MAIPQHLGIEIELCTDFEYKCQGINLLDITDELLVTGPDNRTVGVPGKASGLLLKNGGILYDDVGDHIEYASPETKEPLDLILGACAVQYALLDIMNSGSSNGQKFQMNARSIAPSHPDEKRTNANRPPYSLFANHENYEIPDLRLPVEDTLRSLIAMHVISRTVFGGAGAIIGGEPRLSGRVGYASTGRYFNSNDNSLHGDKSEYLPRLHPHGGERSNRFEVRIAEDQPSDWAKFVNVASTALLIDAVTSHEDAAIDFLQNHSLSMHALAGVNLKCDVNALVKFKDGKVTSVLDVQQALYDFTAAHIDTKSLSPQYAIAFEEWGQILTDLRDNAIVSGDGRIDWFERRAYWESVRFDAYERGFTDDDICFSYDAFPNGKGFHLNRKNIVRLGADYESKAYTTTPPSANAARRVSWAQKGLAIKLWPS